MLLAINCSNWIFSGMMINYIKMLYDITGINPKEIPLDDKETMSIFSSLEPLNLKNNDINTLVGTLGVPRVWCKNLLDRC